MAIRQASVWRSGHGPGDTHPEFIDNGRESVGYNTLMSAVRGGDTYDAWGLALHWLCVIGDVMHSRYGIVMPEYGPSPMQKAFDPIPTDDEFEDARWLMSEVMNHSITGTDMHRVYRVINRWADWAQLAGRDY